ncbi:TrkA C-terminal domain-containing protein [Cohnella ginsengisoli]|uniref:TrkA C-terminal domain-containing protein n=1 Tax=Cohnella ginsengisoli TaxID=425004 RepID=A0A9X4QQB0_9BACL|nr:TrkA C-terminal domain-containing protein [Cohnella ginsengisoli]MDG0795214.1 TrkA C-terminal domain-containing protein [Cohnella ginsengisoli]
MGFILVYILIVFLVVEISAILMRATGLEHPIARFQVISLLTGTGFTTKESELILGHPVRRRIGIFLILFGAFSLAVMISCVSAIIAPDFHLYPLSLASGALVLVYLALRIPAVTKQLEKRMSGAFRQSFAIHELAIQEVLYLEKEDAFIDIPIDEASPAIGRKIRDLCDRLPDVNILLIKRGTIAIRDRRMETPLEAGDVLYVYGSMRQIKRSFSAELEAKKAMERDERQAVSPL